MQKIYTLLVLLGVFLASCTPYGAKKEEVRPVKEYRAELTDGYVERIIDKPEKNKEKLKSKKQQPKFADPVLDVHSLWWYQDLQQSSSAQNIKVKLADLYASSLRHSNQVKVFADIPVIRSTAIEETKGNFDPVLFAEGGYRRTNEPVGNVLRTGNDNDFKENENYFEAGVRKKFVAGTQVEVSEKLQRIQNNSEFTDPNPQTIATLNVSIIQPLLRGAGIEYNETFLRLAELDTEIAKNEYKRQLESHLLEVTRAYWALYLAKGNLLLREKMFDSIKNISEEMKQRQSIDALESQIYHTEAALSFHRAQIIRSKAAVKNARDRLLYLVNDPEFIEKRIDQVVPMDIPYTKWVGVDLNESLLEAIEHRPELEQSYLQIRSSTIRLNASKNELLPILDGIVEFAFTGLEADNDVGGAIGEQFGGSDPGVRVGFRFEYPIWNRTARARHLRRNVEKRQLVNQFKTTMENILFEVKVSVREVETTYEEYLARQKAYVAAKNEIEALSKRRVLETVLQQKEGTSIFLQAFLQAQNNLLDMQFQLMNSLIDYNLAITNLKKSEGTFLAFEKMKTVVEEDDNGLPLWRTVLENYKDKYQN